MSRRWTPEHNPEAFDAFVLYMQDRFDEPPVSREFLEGEAEEFDLFFEGWRAGVTAVHRMLEEHGMVE